VSRVFEGLRLGDRTVKKWNGERVLSKREKQEKKTDSRNKTHRREEIYEKKNYN